MSLALEPPAAGSDDAGDSLEVVDLDESDRAELAALVGADPLVNVVVASRLEAVVSMSPRRMGGRLLGARDRSGRLRGAAFHGGNFLPVGGGPAEWRAHARAAGDGPRLGTSVVGRADAVATCWTVLAPVWGPARVVRERQPLLVARAAVPDRDGPVGLRAAGSADLDRYVAASARMFTEELGVSPFAGAGAAGYRSRVSALIRSRRAWCVTDRSGEIAFKADFGAVSARTCQIQGVWTRPDLRGRGLGTAAMVGVLDRALALAPTASLYVNDFNVAARRMYARLGMDEVAVLSSVLL